MPAAGVRYVWEGERLGGRRKAEAVSPHTALRNEGFRAYADHMGTAPFREGIENLLALSGAAPAAVMCAERLPWRCHRYFLADYLLLRGVRVLHILEAGKTREHRMSRLARVEGGRLVYDVHDLQEGGEKFS